MGLLSTFYTVLGGIEAVVWTDVIQVFIFYLGIGLALLIIFFHIDGGVTGLIDIGMADNKFRAIYWDWDMTYPTMWVVIIGGGCGTLIQYSADQSQIQRYLTTKDEKSAANGLWVKRGYHHTLWIIIFHNGNCPLWLLQKPPGFDQPGNAE